MTPSPMSSVEINRVSRGKPMHPATEIRPAGFGNQMIMIAHQHISVQRYVVAPERFDEQLHEPGAVLFVRENPLASISPSSQMIHRSLEFHSQRPGHNFASLRVDNAVSNVKIRPPLMSIMDRVKNYSPQFPISCARCCTRIRRPSVFGPTWLTRKNRSCSSARNPIFSRHSEEA